MIEATVNKYEQHRDRLYKRSRSRAKDWFLLDFGAYWTLLCMGVDI